jgi:hypothetical protein
MTAPAAFVSRIRTLLDALAAREPVAYDLGTPQLVEAAELDELVALGGEAVAVLMELAATLPARPAAYAVLALGRIGEQRTVPALRGLRAAYEGREPKDEWDFAVIGQATLALRALAAEETPR